MLYTITGCKFSSPKYSTYNCIWKWVGILASPEHLGWPVLLVSLGMLKSQPILSRPAPLQLLFSSEEGLENVHLCPRQT